MVRRRFHDVTRYGAVGDGLSDSTEAIAAAIAAASKAAEPGKHAVLKFPKGTFLTRPFNLSSWLIVEIHGTIKGAVGNAAVRRWPRLPLSRCVAHTDRWRRVPVTIRDLFLGGSTTFTAYYPKNATDPDFTSGFREHGAGIYFYQVSHATPPQTAE